MKYLILGFLTGIIFKLIDQLFTTNFLLLIIIECLVFINYNLEKK